MSANQKGPKPVTQIMHLESFAVISAADFVLFVRLSAHLLIPGNFLISLLSTAVQGELLAFGTPCAVVFVRVPGTASRNQSPGTVTS